MVPAGTIYTIFKPSIWIGPLTPTPVKLPKMLLPLGGLWTDATNGDPLWRKIPHTEEGAVITPTAPKDDINSDEAGGSIGVVPAGGSEITIGFTPLTPDIDLFTWLTSMKDKGTVAAVPSPAAPEYTMYSLTPEGRQFRIGVEGTVDAGSLTAAGGFVRAFGYRVEQTEEVEINMRRTGEDAVMRLGAAVRCMTTALSTTEKNGITPPAGQDFDSRFDMFYIGPKALI